MKYSVLVPVYKSHYLSDCIDSILGQTYKDFELIIINDASPYPVDDIVRTYSDTRIQYYTNNVGFGAENVVDNWNKCLSYAKGEYVICMGDDDRLLPNCLEEYSHLIQKYPDLDIYHARTELIDEDGNMIGLQEARPEWESAYSALWHQCSCHRIQYLGDFLFRTSSLKDEGGFYKLPLAIYSDNISTIRAAKRKGIANTQDVCFQYRRNRYTITNIGNPRILANSIKLAYDWFLCFLQDCPSVDMDIKYRELLLKKDLRKHIYGMMMAVVEQDLENEGLSAISYWKHQIEVLGIEGEQLQLQFKIFRREWLLSKIKLLFPWNFKRY